MFPAAIGRVSLVFFRDRLYRIDFSADYTTGTLLENDDHRKIEELKSLYNEKYKGEYDFVIDPATVLDAGEAKGVDEIKYRLSGNPARIYERLTKSYPDESSGTRKLLTPLYEEDARHDESIVTAFHDTGWKLTQSVANGFGGQSPIHQRYVMIRYWSKQMLVDAFDEIGALDAAEDGLVQARTQKRDAYAEEQKRAAQAQEQQKANERQREKGKI